MQKLEPPRGAPTRWPGDPDRLALVIAGGAYAPARPLLHFSRKVLQTHGWTVQELWWQPPMTTDFRSNRGWVVDQITAALADETAAQILLCGKSLASLAAPIAADRSLPAIWLTPILSDPANAAAVARSTAPTLLIGGDADPLWNGGGDRTAGHEIVELPGEDHSLEVADPLAALATLRQVVTAVDDFVGRRCPPRAARS
ncbi:alpha/beta fold hydrolase [Hamadaea tsunoensis]|uniref:alpha/beta fold hydrolase n=1 Tax=Hamadaea tsunoensis TaxID=53368 RepID=UPI00041C75CD|nr:hypothetical protein [Hamadaea tsunoensis]